MATSNYRMAELVHKHLTGSLSEQESIELNQILSDPDKKKLFEQLMDWDRERKKVNIMNDSDKMASWNSIEAPYRSHNKWFPKIKYILAAAVVISLSLLVIWFRKLPALSKSQQVSINISNGSINEVLKEIRKQTGIGLSLDGDLLKQSKKITLHIEKANLEDLLDTISAGQPFRAVCQNKLITLQPREHNGQISRYIPISRKAIWKRSGGRIFPLDFLDTGIVGHSNGIPVIKNDSELIYSDVKRSNLPVQTISGRRNTSRLPDSRKVVANSASLSDTVQTLRGGYYRLQLLDGSKVVMNSASTISFFSEFDSADRRLSVYGEAYFDIVKDERPFHIQLTDLILEVMEGQFNVRAYNKDYIVITSLGDGGVNVKKKSGQEVVFLKAGEQAVIIKNKKLEKTIAHTEINKAISWKEGAFVFRQETIKEIIGELSRWYDYDFHYNGVLPDDTYYGIFSRSDSITAILKELQKQSGIQFNIVGKRIIIKS